MNENAPTPEQRLAIDSRDRDVFCEAGAGTGKTRVLVERYCDAVELDGVGIEAIFAFTFTERAAAELRSRLRLELGRRAARARESGELELATLLARAGRETERAWVTTIHGFCRRLLATHPAAAGIDPRFRVLDESEASRLRTRARDEALADVADSEPSSIEVIAAYRPYRIGEMAVTAYERLRSQGMIEPKLPPITDPVRSIRDPEKDDPRLTPDERRRAVAARNVLDLVLAAFGRRYAELKTARSGLDFADLELGALDLLHNSEPVAAAWRGRFAHLMVDEFQDTNRVQLELVEALRGPETRVFRVGDELQSIYRFRNADLAVFREQRIAAIADSATEVAPLTGSFRSRPEVISAVNTVGAAVLGEPGFRPLAAAREPAAEVRTELLLTLEEGTANGKLGWQPFKDELSLPSSTRRAGLVAEARELAHRLRELVDGGEAQPGEIVVLLRAFTNVDAYEEALERAGLEPYVVGGRGYWSQQQVEDLLRLLEAVANPLDDEMLLGALACPANGVSPDALWLLRRATMPEQGDADERDRRRPGHLWPLIEWRFGSSDRRPEPLDETWLDAIPADDADRLGRFCTILDGLRAAAPVLALDELVDRAMSEFGYDLHLLARRQGRGRMANVRKLMRLAREFEHHEGRDLRGFLVSARELTKRDEREGVAATQAEDHDGVRIMTVHAAKGLEFPVVAVPDLGRPLAAAERAGDLIIGRADGEHGLRYGLRLVLPASKSFGVWELQELAEEAKAEAAEEGARLVWVGATRAMERLILSGTFKRKQCLEAERSSGDGALERLLPPLAERGWGEESLAAEIALDPAPSAVDGGALAGPASLRLGVSVPSAARARELARVLPPLAAEPSRAVEAAAAPLARPEPVLPVGHLSYSALADYERCGYRFYVERMLGLSEPPGRLHPDAGGEQVGADSPGAIDAASRSRGFGNAVHAALEWSAAADWKPPGDARLSRLLETELVTEPGQLERAREMIDGWLASSLLAELRGAETRAEVPFALAIGQAIVRGQIDLLVLGEQGAGSREPGAGSTEGLQLELLGDAAGTGPTTVVDFKTDRLGGDPPATLADRYRVQRELYALALAATANGAGAETEVRAIHVFLEAPDEPVSETFDSTRLAAARGRLERQIDRIRGGASFEPTSEPSHSVCFGCPAAERLCPHPAWKPGWQ